MSRRAFVVVNPAAGGGRTERLWPGVRDRLVRAGLDFDWALTPGPGGAVALARGAARDGCALVVAVGGDGTLNEVVNGVTDDAGGALAPIGAILTGRGRDACRNLGLARDSAAAADRLVQGGEVAVDLALAEWADGRRRYVLNSTGAGFDAAVARRAAARGGSGTVPYLRAVLASLSAHRPVEATIEIDGRRAWEGRLTAVVVANGAHYGGGMKIAPGADPADGALDVVVLGDFGRLELLRWLPTVYRGGHLASAKVAIHRGRRVRILAGAPLPTHVDGEGGADTPLTVSVCPGALRLRR